MLHAFRYGAGGAVGGATAPLLETVLTIVSTG